MNSTKKILVVDDNENIRIYVSTLLQRAGYTVLQTTNGLNGIQMLKKNPDIKLVLLDIMMPIMSGFDFLQALKNVPIINDLKVCMMTAISSKEEIVKSLQLGANDYIVKVIDKEILLDKVLRLLDSHQAEKFVELDTNLSAEIKNAPLKIKMSVSKISECYLQLEGPIELYENRPITLNIPHLDKLWGKEVDFICIVQSSKQTSVDKYSSRLVFSGLSEDISKRIREITVNKKQLIELEEEQATNQVAK